MSTSYFLYSEFYLKSSEFVSVVVLKSNYFIERCFRRNRKSMDNKVKKDTLRHFAISVDVSLVSICKKT